MVYNLIFKTRQRENFERKIKPKILKGEEAI